MSIVPITNALISVSDKMGLAPLAKALAARGVTIYSTGGTRKHLESEGLAIRDIAEYTGFPEMMDGRLKTLHPKVFGGLLCRHDRGDDMQAIREHGIVKFQLVVVNLYPFEATIAKPGVTPSEAIEQIDIGGPSLVRASAKNHQFTTIATSPEQYAAIITEFETHGGTSLDLRKKLAAAAFARTAEYDRAIADWFAQHTGDVDGNRLKPVTASEFPATYARNLRRKEVLRYGENPHQRAAVYAEANFAGASLVAARQLGGKELSYNNLLDLDAALAIARSLPHFAATVIKHNNPCGAASASSLAEAMRKALAGDPQSAFGGVIGLNRACDAATAEVLAAPGNFVEAIVAPDFDAGALEILTTKPKWKTNVRLMAVGSLDGLRATWQSRWIEGGLLVQHTDFAEDPETEWRVATEKQPTPAQLAELRFAWAIVRHVKSNAITLSKDLMLCGAGAGQMSRVDSVEIAIQKAGDRAAGCALASDAFFPFPDSIHRAKQAGITAIIQPGGSVKDDEVIAACNEHGMPMVFTGRRHFKH